MNNAGHRPRRPRCGCRRRTSTNLDVTIGLTKILAGHQIYIQDYDDASKWIKYNVTAAVDSRRLLHLHRHLPLGAGRAADRVGGGRPGRAARASLPARSASRPAAPPVRR